MRIHLSIIISSIILTQGILTSFRSSTGVSESIGIKETEACRPSAKKNTGQTHNEKQFLDNYSKLSKLLSEKKFSMFANEMRKAQVIFPGNVKLLELKKKFVIEDYKSSVLSNNGSVESKYFEKAPNSGSCQPGLINAAGHKYVLDRINYVRRLAGLYDSCVFDPVLNKKSQQAAMMMESNGTLDHSPKSNWKCYSKDGAVAAGSSNLSLGYTFADAIMGQMEDDGAGNGACGHRRWILNPNNNVFGHGSTRNAMTLYVFGSNDQKLIKKTGFTDSQFVAWPAADYFPLDLVPERWSFSLANADFTKARVSVTVNGKPVKVKMEPVKTGYAMNTLVWTMDKNALANDAIKVSISQVKVVSGWGRTSITKTRSYTYQVTPVQIQ